MFIFLTCTLVTGHAARTRIYIELSSKFGGFLLIPVSICLVVPVHPYGDLIQNR